MVMYNRERKQFDKRKMKRGSCGSPRTQCMLPVVRSGVVPFCFEKDTTVARLSFRNHGAGCGFTWEGGL